jgi:hypothetical protein
VIFSLQPRQHGIARKEISPSFQGLRHFNPKLLRLLHDWRTRVWSENVCPEFRSGETATHIHYEIHGLAPLFSPFTWKSEDDVEGRADAGVEAALCAFID